MHGTRGKDSALVFRPVHDYALRINYAKLGIKKGA